jgi:hypothetical protein
LENRKTTIYNVTNSKHMVIYIKNKIKTMESITGPYLMNYNINKSSTVYNELCSL